MFERGWSREGHHRVALVWIPIHEIGLGADGKWCIVIVPQERMFQRLVFNFAVVEAFWCEGVAELGPQFLVVVKIVTVATLH